jgi:hypothetical protein
MAMLLLLLLLPPLLPGALASETRAERVLGYA